jgi:hypothetical protein
MLYLIRNFLKIQLEDDEVLFTFVENMNILYCPSQTALNSSGLDKTILVFVDNNFDDFL